MNRREMLAATASLAAGALDPMATAELTDAGRMAAKRADDRDLTIPECKDFARRARCEADDELWLLTYCGDVFYNPFTPRQKKTIRDCGEALRYGTQKCKAEPRGDGKSSIVKYLTLKYSLTRQVKFPLLLAATGSKAKDALESLKRRMAAGMTINARNKKCVPRSPLGEDYPLECATAAYVDPWPSRARNVTANNQKRIHVEWGANCIILPTWEESEPLGPIILALGITSDELQGCNVYDQRPDFVMLDDLDSRDSLSAADGVIAGKIEEAVDKTIAGMGGQSRRLGKFMLCTITSRSSAAWKYSDPLQKQWSGERGGAIQAWPDRADLWQKYIELRQDGSTLGEDGRPKDVFGRKAHQHYLDNQNEMDAGAVLSNPHNFDASLLPDGSQKQISSLQRCYDYIADHGLISFQTEHQNDPPEDTGTVESGINVTLIRKQLSGIPKLIIPDGCTVLTHACDVGKTKGFHWVVRAWKPNGTRYVIDYGIMDVKGVKWGSNEGIERALYNAVLQRMDEFKTEAYCFANGEVIRESLSLFDARWNTDAICKAVKQCGLGVMAHVGIGKSGGAVQGTFRELLANTQNRRKCGTAHAYEELHTGDYGKLWVVHGDTDHWKAFEHDGWMTAQDKPGCSFLFGGDDAERKEVDERSHEQYASHICAEVEADVELRGFKVRKWIPKAKQNDWLDASYMSCVAAAMKGIRVVGSQPAGRPKPQDRPTARDLAKKSRGAA